jgi:hypothetical protein
MNKTNFLISLVLAFTFLIGQTGSVLAAPASQESDLLAGILTSISLETDPNTGITIVIIQIQSPDQTTQTLRISQKTAIASGLVALDGDGNLAINKLALGKLVEIEPAEVISAEQTDRHPVADALATFFSDVPGMDYDTIMAERDKGIGFSVIAQALWLTKQLQGNSETFEKLLHARETNDYSDFKFGGETPENWGQLRKAILDGKKVDKAGNAESNQSNNKQNKNKNKNNNKDNGNSSNENGNNEDKDKNKNK